MARLDSEACASNAWLPLWQLGFEGGLQFCHSSEEINSVDQAVLGPVAALCCLLPGTEAFPGKMANRA